MAIKEYDWDRTVKAVNPTNLTAGQLIELKSIMLGSGSVEAVQWSTVAATVQSTAEFDIDAGSGRGIRGDGWVVKLTFPFLAGATLNPRKILLSVTDDGHDDLGPVKRTRLIRGVQVIRRQVPNWQSSMVSQVSSNLEAYVQLEDEIYAATVINYVYAEEGYYGASKSGYSQIAVTVNSTVQTYPRPAVGWSVLQNERFTSNTARVKMVAYHRWGDQGRMIARIEFYATDESGNVTPTVTARAPTLSPKRKGKVFEEYVADLDISGLTNGQRALVTAIVYPWLGLPYNITTSGVNTSGALVTSRPNTPLRFVCDRTGAYGGAIAYVKAGASGGAVSSVEGTARSTPFPTPEQAFLACQTWNNANKGHNDHSGSIIRLMDDGAGGAVGHVMATNMSSLGVAAGKCVSVIEPDPLNTARAFISLAAGHRVVSPMTRWMVDIDVAAAGASLSGGSNMTGYYSYQSCTINYLVTGTSPFNYTQGIGAFLDVTLKGVTNAGQSPWTGFGTSRNQTSQLINCEMTEATINFSSTAATYLGCDFKNISLAEVNLTTQMQAWGYESSDGLIVANTMFRAMRNRHQLGNYQEYTCAAIIQNVSTYYGDGGLHFGFGNDGCLMPMTNVILMYNTIVGERLNIAYQDVAGARGIYKEAYLRANILNELNIKTGTYNIPTDSGIPGNCQNWKTTHHVGEFGNVVQNGSRNADAIGVEGVNPSWLGDSWPLVDGGSYKVGKLSGSAANSTSTGISFIDDQSGLAGAGGGNCQISGPINPAYSRVPAGRSSLSWDINGRPRLNDGRGASGAFERIDL